MHGLVKLPAIHSHWKGTLVLSAEDLRLRLEPFGSTGSYTFSNGILNIEWDNFPAEKFIFVKNTCVQEKYIASLSKLSDLSVVTLHSEVLMLEEVSFFCPHINRKLYLRPASSDPATYHQIFINGEYNLDCLPAEPRVIVDIGANVGLATVYFCAKYPEASIIAVEPDSENFRLLSMNIAPFSSRVVLENAAVWNRDGFVSLRSEDDNGRPLGAWGVQVTDQESDRVSTVRSLRMETLFNKYDLHRVDILKIDIEGAESEIFSSSDRNWLKIVDYIVIETHERFKPGCDEAVRSALADAFTQVKGDTELQVFRRRDLSVKA